jgi:MFS family permease
LPPEVARPGPDPRGLRLGPFWLAPGVSRANGLILLYTSFSTIGLVTWVNFANPYVFALLGVPPDRQGQLASLLVFLQEAVQIVLGGLIGALSDRHGRRVVLVGGLVLMAAGYAVYPLAGTELQLVLLRAFYSVGMTAATVMVSTSLAEYTQEGTRGRWMGAAGVCNGLGVVLTAVLLSRLPQFLASRGFGQAEALTLSFWCFAAYLVLLAAIARAGLVARSVRPAGPQAGLLRQTLHGLTIARESPRIALAYATAFASRGDLVILTTFMSLWLVQAGLADGLTPAEATGRAGRVFGLAQGVALVWSFAMGFILDRVTRLTGIVIAFGLACAGYLALGQVDDPLGSAMVPAAMLAGVGEASAVVAAGVFIGQEAPAVTRGVVLGTFGVAGSVGMVVLSGLGGQVFDRFGGGTPFLLMGVVNGCVALLALRVRAGAAGAVGAAPGEPGPGRP